MTISTARRVDTLLNQLGDVAANFVGHQKTLFTEAGIKNAQASVVTLLDEITITARELPAEKIGDTPAAAYIYARAVADAMAEQSAQTPLLSGHHLRKLAGAASHEIFHGINEMTEILGKAEIDTAAKAATAKTAQQIRFAPGKANNKITIA